MKNVGEHIKKSLQKGQEAMQRFQARREEFLVISEQITRDIEEARNIWIKTLEQLPGLEFNSPTPAKSNPREVTKRKRNNH